MRKKWRGRDNASGVKKYNMFKSTSTGKKEKRETAITFQLVVDSKWETRENICWTNGSWILGVTQVQSSLSVLLRLEGGSMSSQDVPETPDR